MDFMMTSYVPNIDPYIKLAAELKEKYEYEYKFIKGVTSSPDVPLYSVLLENPDGQIFEFVSVALYQARTKKQKTKTRLVCPNGRFMRSRSFGRRALVFSCPPAEWSWRLMSRGVSFDGPGVF